MGPGTVSRLFTSSWKRENNPAHDDILAALISRLDVVPFERVYDVPTARLQDGRTSWYQNLRVAFHGNHALVLQSGWNGSSARLADFGGPNRLKPALSPALTEGQRGDWHDAAFLNETLAVFRNGETQIRFLTCNDLDKPQFRGVLQGKRENRGSFQHLAVANGYVFVAAATIKGQGGGLHVVRATDPDRPEIVVTLPIPGVNQIAAVPGRPLIAALSRGPAPENLLSTILSHLGVGQKRGEVSLFHLIDVSDPTNPTVLSALEMPHANRLAVTEQFAYVALSDNPDGYGGNNRLQVIDIADAGAPRKRGAVSLTSWYGGDHIAAVNGYVYVAPRYGAMVVVDATNPSQPKSGRGLSANYVQGMTVQDKTLFVVESRGMSLWNLEHSLENPKAFGIPPTAPTLGYMKRRVRRFLRSVATSDASRFTALATRVLSEPGRPDAADPNYHWVSMDLLFGGGGRFEQTSHGRGHYKELRPRGLSIRRREERSPEAWYAHPENAAVLFTAESASWQAREMALRVLRAAKRTIPALKEKALGKALVSPSLLLTAEAVRQTLAAMEGNRAVPAVAAADAIARSNPRLRRRLLARAGEVAGQTPDWAKDFTKQFLTYLPNLRGSNAEPSRRAVKLSAQFAAYFPAQTTGETLVHLTPLLLRSGDPNAYQQLLTSAKQATAADLPGWLEVLAGVPDASVRDSVLAVLAEAVSGKTLPTSLYERTVMGPPAQAPFLWRLLAASTPDTAALRNAWTMLLENETWEAALRTAIASPDALALLGAAGITDDEMAGYLQARPVIVDLLTPEAFARLTQTLPASLTLRLAGAASDEAWGRLREGWLRNLREGVGLTDLWTSAEAALKADTGGRLEARLLGDAEVAATFADVEDAEAILGVRDPSFGALLSGYWERHSAKIAANDALFLMAATHPLPEVRTPALERLAARPIFLPFALGLLESEVPASAEAGRNWFETTSEPSLLDRALALCDSPAASVRAIGRDFVTAHREELPLDTVATSLTEHGDAVMQAFAARLLGNAPAPMFDREILRTRHRSRQAKELVKARQEMRTDANEGAVDVETLLALARGSATPRDAEWALAQLVRRALAGEEVEGLVLESGPVAAPAKSSGK